jgi:hypothetical protein
MFLARLGSLNALEGSRESRFWQKWLGRAMPSADTVGRVCAGMELEDVRGLQHQFYARIQRMKAWPALPGGLRAAVLDGHESHATYRRRCKGCLRRVVHTARGDRIQYYHRQVTIELLGAEGVVLLDAEPIRPGEGEVQTAIRLLDRVLQAYPRAFDVVLGDSLYADSGFFNYLLDHGKHGMAVLKDENRELWKDAESLIGQVAPSVVQRGRRQCCQWDIEGFRTWPQVRQPVRVVRSVETWTVRRQLDGRREEQRSEWTWVTTLPSRQAPTKVAVDLGHGRWKIENEGFNELVNHQHADHVYKHQPHAMLVFCLLAMLCLNVFLVFYRRNLKPPLRARCNMLTIARRIAGELYSLIPGCAPRAPP